MNGILNQNIRNFRKFKGISQEELGNQIGKSKNVISNWERGDNSPDIDCVEMICQVLGVTPNQLFGWEPYEEYNEYLSIMAKKQEELHYLEEQSKEIQSRIGDLLISIKTEEEKWRNS